MYLLLFLRKAKFVPSFFKKTKPNPFYNAYGSALPHKLQNCNIILTVV